MNDDVNAVLIWLVFVVASFDYDFHAHVRCRFHIVPSIFLVCADVWFDSFPKHFVELAPMLDYSVHAV